MGSEETALTPDTDTGRRQVRLVHYSDVGQWPLLAQSASTVLVVAERHYARSARQHAAIAADLGLHVAWRTADLGPLALLLTARNTVHVASSAGMAVLTFESMAANTWSGAWMKSVAKLTRPAPNIAAHVRSLLPGDGYIVELGSEPAVTAVRRLTKRPRIHDAELGPRGPLVHSADLPDAAASVLPPLTGSVGSFLLPTSDEVVQERFGSERAVELAVLPESDPTPQVATGLCAACGTAVPPHVCPFCHIRTPQLETRGALA